MQPKTPTEELAAQTKSLSTLVEIQNTQSIQIAQLKSQNEQMIELLSKQQLVRLGTDELHVKIEDVNMPFGALVGFMLKISFASIPAAIILAILYLLVVAIFGGILTGCT